MRPVTSITKPTGSKYVTKTKIVSNGTPQKSVTVSNGAGTKISTTVVGKIIRVCPAVLREACLLPVEIGRNRGNGGVHFLFSNS